jgi:hypothetical protein
MAEGNAHRETVLLWLAVQEAKHGNIHWPWLRWFAPAQAPRSRRRNASTIVAPRCPTAHVGRDSGSAKVRKQANATPDAAASSLIAWLVGSF